MTRTSPRWPMQVGAFVRKELSDIVRQPRTLLVMVLGPFAIMAAFGIGYRETTPPLRTVFVVPAGSPFAEQVDRYADSFSSLVELRGTLDDQAEADRLLREGDVDVVVAFPADPLGSVLSGERAELTVTHTRLDPIERTAILFVSQIAVDEVNAQVLARVIDAGQEESSGAAELLDRAGVDVDTARAGTADDATRTRLVATLDSISLLAGSLGALGTTADAGEEGPQAAYATELRRAAARLDAVLAADPVDAAAVNGALDAVDALLADDRIASLLDVDAEVIVRPLERSVELAVDDVDDVTDWYAPAAVVLLLQQFGIAFAALAFVRERQLGIEEVYRIAPVGGSSSVIGKYVAYLTVGATIGAALTALVVATLGVPMVGGVGRIAGAMALTLVASIGLGFVISLVSSSDAQAVQYTMLVLLASLFFSGFFLSLDQMQGAARWISYLLPVSYGMRLLRDVMLRGAGLEFERVVGLASYGAALFVIALLGARRRMGRAS